MAPVSTRNQTSCWDGAEKLKTGNAIEESTEAGPLIRPREVERVAEEHADLVRAGELDRWTLPPHAQTARFTIRTRGFLPATADSAAPAVVERQNAIRRFVQENLTVYVDIAELPEPGAGRSVPVRWSWRKNWRDSPDSLGLDAATLSGHEALDVRLESEPDALLEERVGAALGRDEDELRTTD